MSVHVRRTAVVYLAVFVAAVLVSTTILGVALKASKDERAADRASQQAQAQASIVADQRKAQSRRIDLLTDQIHDLEARAREQAVTVGRQEQAIRDLAAQVQASGQSPVVTSVAPRRTSTRTPAPKPGTKPTTRPTTVPTTAPKPPADRPTPATSSSPGLICGLLIIVC